MAILLEVPTKASLTGGDADTLAAIAGPMAFAYYKEMPDALVAQAMKMLPDWMVDVSERFDKVVNGKWIIPCSLWKDRINSGTEAAHDFQ